jgi:HD-like signal output (HDOD) protein
MKNLKKQILFVGASELGHARELAGLNELWEITAAESGSAAVALLENRAFDAMVTDEALPDMDGFKLLDQAQARHPDTRRFVLSDLADPRTAVKSARFAHQCVPKPWDAEILSGMLERAFILGAWFSNSAARDLIRRLTVVPSPPDLYFAVARALNSPEADLVDIARRAERDPAMTGKLLKVANSAALGLRHQITNVAEAIQYLGLETTRSLILLTHTFSYCDRGRAAGFNIEKLWQHSLTTGRLARGIARKERAAPNLAEEAFLAGLLHDIGELLFAVNLPEEYGAVLREARERTADRAPLWQVESSRLGVSHAEIGAELIAGWSLPVSVVEALALHHQPSQILSAGFSPLTAVHVADVVAEECEGGDPTLEASGIEMDYLTHLGLANRLDSWRAACQDNLESAAS